MKQYPKASDEKCREYLDRARQWMDENFTANRMWHSSTYAARTAVAEYIANQDGYTIYECCALEVEESK